MPYYLIARKEGNKKYYLENIYPENKVIWVTSKKYAFLFTSETYLKKLIAKEFPGRNYYIEILHDKE